MGLVLSASPASAQSQETSTVYVDLKSALLLDQRCPFMGLMERRVAVDLTESMKSMNRTVSVIEGRLDIPALDRTASRQISDVTCGSINPQMIDANRAVIYSRVIALAHTDFDRFKSTANLSRKRSLSLATNRLRALFPKPEGNNPNANIRDLIAGQIRGLRAVPGSRQHERAGAFLENLAVDSILESRGLGVRRKPGGTGWSLIDLKTNAFDTAPIGEPSLGHIILRDQTAAPIPVAVIPRMGQPTAAGADRPMELLLVSVPTMPTPPLVMATVGLGLTAQPTRLSQSTKDCGIHLCVTIDPKTARDMMSGPFRIALHEAEFTFNGKSPAQIHAHAKDPTQPLTFATTQLSSGR